MATTITGSGVTTGSVTASGELVGDNLKNNPLFTPINICSFPNTTAYPNVSTFNFTLTEEQAPIGSYVILQLNIYSGSNAGDQYAYLTQNTRGSTKGSVGGYVTDWYFKSYNQGFYKIESAADRAFTLQHASVVASSTSDSRGVWYCGYIMNN